MGFTVWTTVWMARNSLKAKELAERVGFEPTLPFRVNTLSKRAPSATRPSLPISTFRMLSNYCTHACAESVAPAALAQRIAVDGINTAVWFLLALDKTHAEDSGFRTSQSAGNYGLAVPC